MKKLVATAPDQVEVVDVEMPEMGEDEILVRGVRSLLSPGSELKRVRQSEAHPGPWPNPDLGYAMAGVVEEAMHYRKQEISLNIVMLDNNPFLKRFASTLARKNLGRTFFTYPWKLGEVLIEDYLRSRKIRA